MFGVGNDELVYVSNFLFFIFNYVFDKVGENVVKMLLECIVGCG